MTEAKFTLLKCLNTCYMPLAKGDKQLERFEDESTRRETVAPEVPNNLVKSYLATGNFVAA